MPRSARSKRGKEGKKSRFEFSNKRKDGEKTTSKILTRGGLGGDRGRRHSRTQKGELSSVAHQGVCRTSNDGGLCSSKKEKKIKTLTPKNRKDRKAPPPEEDPGRCQSKDRNGSNIDGRRKGRNKNKRGERIPLEDSPFQRWLPNPVDGIKKRVGGKEGRVRGACGGGEAVRKNMATLSHPIERFNPYESKQSMLRNRRREGISGNSQ